MKDKFGKVFKPGDVVAKPVMDGATPGIEIRTVQRIENGRIYLSGWGNTVVRAPEKHIILSGIDWRKHGQLY